MTKEQIIKSVSSWYAVRCWWATVDDLEQEAWVAILEAEKTYNPTKGNMYSYFRRAAALRLKDYAWSVSSPVSGVKGRKEKLRGMIRESDEKLELLPYDNYDIEYRYLELSRPLLKLIKSCKHGDIAIRVFFNKEKPKDIAEEYGWPVHKIWGITSAIRKIIKSDYELISIMSDRL